MFPFYKKNNETIYHLIEGCHFTKEGWIIVKTLLGGYENGRDIQLMNLQRIGWITYQLQTIRPFP